MKKKFNTLIGFILLAGLIMLINLLNKKIQDQNTAIFLGVCVYMVCLCFIGAFIQMFIISCVLINNVYLKIKSWLVKF